MLEWLSNMENTKPLALVIFFASYVGIVWYILANKKRSQRLESYKNIPFQEEDDTLTQTQNKLEKNHG